jgi:hypothetical protein
LKILPEASRGSASRNWMSFGTLPHAIHADPRSNSMTPHIPEEFSPGIDWGTLVIVGNTMPPRDPDEDDEDEGEDRADEPVVREPDEE